jgi:UDP-N-acetylglucosamine--N-acetylmuramyl-(pentapeptide) pyrophosphoryl-undecaprenol N-acetylglucosamine transferase
MRIVLAGGGTAGSVMPLIAIAHELKQRDPGAEFLFIGSRQQQPERSLAGHYGLPYQPVYAGKLRRYVDVRNLTDFFVTVVGFFQSMGIMYRFRPDVIIGAGSYVQVPVMWAGWMYGATICIHQQDVQTSLSNIMVLNLAASISVSFPASLERFPSGKTQWTGNPVRPDLLEGRAEKARDRFGLSTDIPCILVIGGGTGAVSLNNIVQQTLPHLLESYQVVHITGKGKAVAGAQHPRYHQYEFVDAGMPDLLAAADILVSRSGMSAISEYAALGKVVILVPLPDSHQEKNAVYVAEKQAAIVIAQKDLSPSRLADTIRTVLADDVRRQQLSQHMRALMKPNATQVIVDQIMQKIS